VGFKEGEMNKTYGVYDAATDELVEGGFFSKAAAEQAMESYTNETGKSAYCKVQPKWEGQ
jgi:hypothetical protein